MYRASDPLAAARSLCRQNKPAVAVVQLGDIAGLTRVFIEEQIPVLVYFHDLYSVDPVIMRRGERLLSFAASSEFLAGKIRAISGCEVAVLPVIVQPDAVVDRAAQLFKAYEGRRIEVARQQK